METSSKMNVNLKNWIFSHPLIIGLFLKFINFFNPLNHVKGGSKNSLKFGIVLQNNVKVTIEGTGNIINIGDFTRLKNTTIYIHGNNNQINIGSRCYLYNTDFYIEDDNGKINIGEHTSIDGETQFAVIEGTIINVGKDCMFSRGINIRTGDAHSILDVNGKRINKSQSVIIGDHCWIGMHSIIMKGTVVERNSIIGAGSIVSSKFEKGNCIIAGIPGRVIRTEINWCRQRIIMED